MVGVAVSETFDKFWKAYPNKQGKAAAKKKWAAKKLDALGPMIIAHVEVRAKKDKKWREGFVPMPTTFINQERWEDEYESVKDARTPEERKAAIDPDALDAGLIGACRFYGIDYTSLKRSDAEHLIWAARYAGSHRASLSDELLKRLPM